MKAKKYLCPNCRKTVELSAKPKRSFMGFLRIPCPTCQKEFRYPLTMGYVVFYWILLVGNVALVVSILSQGKMVIPNPIGIVILIYVIISLVKSRALKQKITELQESVIEN
jgi:cobalamin biosynthesis protein CobD/CbiB